MSVKGVYPSVGPVSEGSQSTNHKNTTTTTITTTMIISTTTTTKGIKRPPHWVKSIPSKLLFPDTRSSQNFTVLAARRLEEAEHKSQAAQDKRATQLVRLRGDNEYDDDEDDD